MIPEHMEIRPLRQQDITSLLRIESLSGYAPWNKSHFEAEISNAALSGSRIFVAVMDNGGDKNLAGYICFRILCEEEYILKISVHPEFRHKGIGTALISRALKHGALNCAEHAVLEVSARNIKAVNLYRKMGFGFIKGSTQTDTTSLLMRKKL